MSSCPKCYELHGPILPELDDYDWKEVFKYADPTCVGHAHKVAVLGQDGVSLAPFSRETVVRLIASAEGENDGDDWIAVGELRDGRFFVIRAGCDYTGWG